MRLIPTPAGSTGETLSLHPDYASGPLSVKPNADGSGSAVTSWTSGASKYWNDGTFVLRRTTPDGRVSNERVVLAAPYSDPAATDAEVAAAVAAAIAPLEADIADHETRIAALEAP